MDVHSNASSSATSSLFGEFIPHAMEGGEDGSLEWLSIYVEDCLSSTPTYFISPPVAYPHHQKSSAPPSNPPPQPPIRSASLHDPPVPAKARTKRRRLTPSSSSLPLDADQSLYAAPSEPLLHHQTCWLADSELLLPKREEDSKAPTAEAAVAAAGGQEEEEEEEEEMEMEEAAQGRRCSHCLSQKTPQWRAGPLGPKTLCNACGVRFKSGRLLPEYRPAKSPTFVSYKHSNSHKKVMEMRMALLSSTSSC